MKIRSWLVIVTALIFVSPHVSSAAVITFDGLSGANGDDFPSPYTEAGFVVTATDGFWAEGHLFGNPASSIFVGAGVTPLVFSSIEITRADGGAFTFSSVDLASLGDAAYEIWGDGLDQIGFIDPTQVFTTIPSDDASLALTSLTISIDPDPEASSFNIDNIVVDPVVPEPATAALFLAGLGALWLLRRSRRCVGLQGERAPTHGARRSR